MREDARAANHKYRVRREKYLNAFLLTTSDTEYFHVFIRFSDVRNFDRRSCFDCDNYLCVRSDRFSSRVEPTSFADRVGTSNAFGGLYFIAERPGYTT